MINSNNRIAFRVPPEAPETSADIFALAFTRKLFNQPVIKQFVLPEKFGMQNSPNILQN